MTETRAAKAQRLVDEGRVEITFVDLRRTGRFTGGRVRGERLAYSVVLYPCGSFHCDCKGAKLHSCADDLDLTDLCAHALAVKLAVEKEK